MASDKERDPGSSSAEIGKYLDILAKDPHSRVFAPLAEAYRKAGLFDDAIEIAREGLKVHPNYLGGRVALGRAYFEKKQYAEAAAEMQKVTKSAPDNIIAHKVLGQIAYSQSDLPAAEKAFKMVLLLDPRDQEAHQFIAGLAGGVSAAPPPAPMPPVLTTPATPPVTVAVKPTATPPAPPPRATPPLTEPLPPPSAWPAESQPHVSIPAVPLPFDEIQSIEDLDLQADDIFGELSPAAPFPQPVSKPPPPAASPATEPRGNFGEDLPLDLAEPESWLPERQSPAASGETYPARPAPESPVVTPATPVEQSSPDDGMEVEVFSRVPWGKGTEGAASSPRSPTPSQPAPQGPLAAPEETESPFEVFGRPKRGGPPQSTKGEQTAFGEIDLESATGEPEQSEPEPATESPFEMFTRQPVLSPAPAPVKASRSVAAEPREFAIETTAYTPSDTFTPDGVDGSPLSLDEELPRIDLAREMDFSVSVDALPSSAATVAGPAAESEPGLDLEMDRGADQEADRGPGLEEDRGPDLEMGGLAPPDLHSLETTSPLEPGSAGPPSWKESREVSLDAEIPSNDRPQSTRGDALGDDDDDEEVMSAAEPAGAAAARGVFDTETLATIYCNQGFYGRAAEIYRRLIIQRPDDIGLRGKLEGVLALERGASEHAEPAAAVAAADDHVLSPAGFAPMAGEPAGPLRAGSGRMISQLEGLLEAFKGGRSR